MLSNGACGRLVTTIVALNASTPTKIVSKVTYSGAAPFTVPRKLGLILQNQTSVGITYSENASITASSAATPTGFYLAPGDTAPKAFTDLLLNCDLYAIAATGTPSLVVGNIYE